MGAPRRLININAYSDGEGFLGVLTEFEEPKLALAMTDYKGGGMFGSVALEDGLEKMEATITLAGHERSLVRKFGTPRLDGVRLRLVAAYRSDDGAPAQAVEVYLGGRFTEIDFGKSKSGNATEHKYKAAATYYRRVVDGIDEVEIDLLGGIFIVGGVDRYAEIMSILTG